VSARGAAVERDREARRLAQSEFERPLVLEAGAGTGKTAALVARVVVWSLGPGWERTLGALAQATPERDTGARDPKPALAGPQAALAGPKPASAGRDAERVAARVLERVVAITFTDAAAAEMAERVGEALTQVERGAVPIGIEADRLPPASVRPERARALLGNLDRLVVRTIHSFCRRLLASYPLELGLHPGFEVDGDGSLLADVARDVTEAAVVDAYGTTEPSPLFELAVAGQGPAEIETALLELVQAGVPARALDADPLAEERIRAVLDDARSVLAAFRTAESGALSRVSDRSGRTHDVDDGLHEIASLLERTGANALALGELAEGLRERWSKERGDRLRKWSNGEFNKSEGTALEPLGTAFPTACRRLSALLSHLSRLQPVELDRARRALAPLLAQVEAELRARGTETYASLLEHARELLAEHRDVRERARRGIDQLLVDEFQDTDGVQCEIVSWLALDGDRDARPGLFVVGDPKQSIYGWRGADLAAYDAFVERVRTVGGTARSLCVNFRSVPAVLDEVERSIAPVMLAESCVQPAFEGLAASDALAEAPGFRAGERRPVEYWVSWPCPSEGALPKPGSALGASELEARALALDIRELRDAHDLRWSDFGVLFRSRGDLDEYVSELRAARVPHVVAGDRNYYRRREIIDATALVRCVLDPNDHLSLLTWLRSPAVGVPDAALLPLWRRQLPASLTNLRAPEADALRAIEAVIAEVAASPPEDVPGLERIEGWERSAIEAVRVLARARASFATDPADRFVEQLREDSLVELTEAARYQGAYRVANLERFFRELTTQLESAEREPQAVLRGLRASVERGEEAEEARPKQAAEDAVQMLTIHQAKGLAFRHVYVMQLHKQTGGGGRELAVAGRAGGRFEYRLFGAPTPGFGALAEAQRLTSQAEQVRTLYVAMTRARERLVLAGRFEHSERAAAEARSHAELLSHRIGPADLESLVSSASAEGDDVADARFRFPALASAALDESARDEAAPLADHERVERDARAIRARQEWAERRMQRVTSRPASEDPERDADAADDSGDRVPALAGASERRVARAVGTAVHRLLETLDLEREHDAAAELERRRGEWAAWLEAALPPDELERGLRRADEVLDHLARGPLLARLGGLRERVVARELPLLQPPGQGELAPVGFVTGAIDLLYRDPASDALVVADFKTDRLDASDPGAAAEHAQRYRAQAEAYTRAVQEALGLERRPRFELWFLDAGQVEAVSPGPDG
jgi:ATP-dependent helicase/nuclease subunit A